MQNQRLAAYLDDWFLLNAIKSRLLIDKDRTLNLLARFGFLVNKEKSQLVPLQQIVYIGGMFQLKKDYFFQLQTGQKR